jgi:hypothetical protein
MENNFGGGSAPQGRLNKKQSGVLNDVNIYFI